MKEKKAIISGIYKITSPVGKVYIGKSKDIHKRFHQYKLLLCKLQRKLYHSLRKHGVDNHIFEIIHECSESEINLLEIRYIDEFKCFNSKSGLNLRKGGEGGSVSDETRKRMSSWQIGKVHSEETKKKISKSLTGKKQSAESILKRSQSESGEKNCWFGKKIPHLIESNKLRKGEKRTADVRKAMSESKKGAKNSFYGKKHKEESLQKMRNSHKNISQETRDKLSSARLGKKWSKTEREKRRISFEEKKSKKIIQ